MASLGEIWSALRGVRSLRFEARSEADTGWNGVGTGRVIVSEPSSHVLLFEEAGEWQPVGRAALRFTNVFRWTALTETARLEHLRFGPDHPVFLFDLAAGADGVWRQVGAHQCREDCYTASLAVEPGKLVVAWSIEGPNKYESIRYEYW